jgi:hypothetical protein
MRGSTGGPPRTFDQHTNSVVSGSRDEFVREFVLKRASTFRPGFEREDGWEAILAGQSVFTMMLRISEAKAREQAMRIQELADGMAQAQSSSVQQAASPLTRAPPPTPKELSAFEVYRKKLDHWRGS